MSFGLIYSFESKKGTIMLKVFLNYFDMHQIYQPGLVVGEYKLKNKISIYSNETAFSYFTKS